ncbi:MAG TPA: hypothetical protein VM925_33655 [Labilithrix sp.]|nr:hypothetical protein [Labilithrix sp.]
MPNTTLPSASEEGPSHGTPHSLHYDGGWYGWQTLIVDGVSAGATIVPVSASQFELAAVGLAGYVLGGPIVHAAHGRWATAGIALALRVALPTLAGGIAYQVAATIDPCRKTEEGVGCDGAGLGLAAVVGFFGLLGAAGATAIDSAVLAHDDRPPSTNTVTLGVRPTRGGVVAGLGGTF